MKEVKHCILCYIHAYYTTLCRIKLKRKLKNWWISTTID